MGSPPIFVLNFLLAPCPLFFLSILESLVMPPHWCLCLKSDRSHELRAHVSAGISNSVCLKIKSIVFISSNHPIVASSETFRSSSQSSHVLLAPSHFFTSHLASFISSAVQLCLSVLMPYIVHFRRPLSHFSPVMFFSDSCVMLPTDCFLKDTYCFI